MFQLYKKRNFSDYISDTIAFFKTYGKHFFKNYLLINGGLLLVLCFLLYFILKIYFEVIFSATGSSNSDYFTQYFNSNATLFIGTFIVFVILVLLLSILNFAYPVLYLQFISTNPNANFTSKDIIKAFLQNGSRILLFLTGLIFLIFPLIMVVFVLLFLMIFILIGVPLLFIAFPTIIAWVNLSFYDYITTKSGFFSALKNGYRMVKQQFWPIIGTTFVVLLIIQVVQGIVTMIPYFIGIISFFTSDQIDTGNLENSGLQNLGIFATVLMILGILLSYFFNNLIIINQGIIYYSLREENDSTTLISNIDLIGSNDE